MNINKHRPNLFIRTKTVSYSLYRIWIRELKHLTTAKPLKANNKTMATSSKSILIKSYISMITLNRNCSKNYCQSEKIGLSARWLQLKMWWLSNQEIVNGWKTLGNNNSKDTRILRSLGFMCVKMVGKSQWLQSPKNYPSSLGNLDSMRCLRTRDLLV